MNANGDIDTVGFIDSGTLDKTNNTTAKGVQISYGGNVVVQREGTIAQPERAYSVYQGSTETLALYSDGSAYLGGTIPSAPNISLNAGGKIETVGEVNSDVWFWSKNNLSGTAGLYLYNFDGNPSRVDDAVVISPTTTQANASCLIEYDGSVNIGGNLDRSTGAFSPNIALNADGTAVFKGSVASVGTTGDSTMYPEGQIWIKTETSITSPAFAVSQVGGNQTFGVYKDGTLVIGPNIQFGGGGPIDARASITTAGVISAVTTTIQPISSERRLKENIVAIDSDTSWETIKSTPYYAYNFIGSDTTTYGPMADEVPAEMVINTDRSDDEGVIRTFDNGMLQARLYSALQTALNRIEDLEARLDAAGV